MVPAGITFQSRCGNTPRRSRSTSVPRIAKKRQLLALTAQHGWPRIGDEEWVTIRNAIPNIAPEDLQILEIPVDPPWSGIRQHTLDELEVSLSALTGVYTNRADLRRFCRDAVIRAKDRAKWASKSMRVAEDKRRIKAEMAEWMLVWLSDPTLFPAWVQIRQSRGGRGC